MTREIQKFWDKQAKSFAKVESRFSAVYTNIIAKTIENLDQNDNLLDYGCATGSKTIELSRKVQHIHGLDISAEMINEANKKKMN